MVLRVNPPPRYVALLQAFDAFVDALPVGSCGTCGRRSASVEYAREPCCPTTPELERLEGVLEDVRVELVASFDPDGDAPRLLGIRDAARLLGISVGSVRSRIHRGTLQVDGRGARGEAQFRAETLQAQHPSQASDTSRAQRPSQASDTSRRDPQKASRRVAFGPYVSFGDASESPEEGAE